MPPAKSPTAEPIQPAVETCRACQGWNAPGAAYCALCGAVQPAAKLAQIYGISLCWSTVWASRAALLGAGVGLLLGGVTVAAQGQMHLLQAARWLVPGPLAALVGTLIFFEKRGFLWPVTLVALSLGIAATRPVMVYHPLLLAGSVGLTLGGLLGLWQGVQRDRALAERDGRCVETLRNAAQARVRGHDQNLTKMRELRLKIQQSVAPSQQASPLHALDLAEQATQAQALRDEISLWRLELAMWQNPLQPIQMRWRQYSVAQCEVARHTLSNALTDGDAMLRRWQAHPQGESDLATRCQGALLRLLQACERLQQLLILRETAALAVGAPDARQAFAEPTLPVETLRQLEILRHGPDLGEISQSLAEIRDTSARIAAHQEAIAEVERLVPAGDQDWP